MADKIRILMTADTVGGVWNYTVELCRALGNRAEVLVATMGAEATAVQRDMLRGLSVHLHESTFRLEWMDDPWDDVDRAAEWLLDLEKVFQPDVIHLNTFLQGTLPWSSPVIMVGHSCVCSWWEAVHGVPAPEEWDRYRQGVRQGLQSVNLVVAPTVAMLRCLDECYGPLPPSRTIHNGLPMPNAPVRPKDEIVFTAGRAWDQAKNVLGLCHAAPGIPWPVYLAGSTTDPGGFVYVLDTMRTLGVLEQETLHHWMARAGIYAAPARYEPFGLAILEAAQRRCALVLGDIPSLRELWSDVAVFVPPDDTEALQNAIGELIRDADRRAYLGRQARERAHNYTPERMAAAYLRAYAEIAGVTVPGNHEVR